MKGGHVKISNKRYTSVKNDHCITFDAGASIVEVHDPQSSIPYGPIFEFTSFEDLKSRGSVLNTIDVIGVVTDLQILT